MVSRALAAWRTLWKRLRRDPWSGPSRRHARCGTSALVADCQAGLLLEERILLSTITVTSAADPSGTHSGVTLRDAIAQANASSGADTIVFAPSLDGTSIKLTQGELSITDALTIRGNGAQNTIVDAQGRSRIFNVTATGSTALNLTLDSVTITGGKTTANMQSGGGISFASSGTLSVVNSAISGNSTTGTGAMGGGIYSTTGSITLTGSTLSGNKTTGSISAGGGVYSVSGAITIRDSTVTGNSTTGEQAFGGGIAATFGNVTIESSTIARNSTTGSYSSGGGLYVRSSAVTLTNSILALNTIVTGGYPDVFINPTFGATFSANHSLIGNRQGITLAAAPVGSPDANGNLIGSTTSPIDPKLGPLADNGGPTATLALLSGSPALDAGGKTKLAIDQRGFTRVVGKAVDMGAFESGATPPTNPAASAPSFDGQYYNPANNQLTSVSLNGQTLTFTNAAGQTTTATLTGTNTVSLPGWTQTATFTNGAFLFSGGSSWIKLDLSPDYTSASGDAVHVTADGTTLTFVNKTGGTSSGFWTSPTQVTASGWNVTGVVSNGRIQWSNGTTWNKNLVVAGTGADGTGQVSISAIGGQIILTDKSGGTSRARITDSGTIVALDWNVTGTRGNGKISWSNGTSWNNFDWNALDAVFADIRSFPFGS